MTELIALRPMENRETISFMSFFAEERERSECSIGTAQACARAATEPPPTFPFLESQCQRAPLKANFHSSRDGNRPQDRQAIGRRGAVYRGLDFPCQTVNALNLQIFRVVRMLEMTCNRSRLIGS
jgi:hypothetical protein